MNAVFLCVSAKTVDLERLASFRDRDIYWRDRDDGGGTPFHRLCANTSCTADHIAVCAEVIERTGIASLRDDKGRTPLHMVVVNPYAKPELIESVVKLWPRGCSATLNTGDHPLDTPLHAACRVPAASAQALATIAKLSPSPILVQGDHVGFVPLMILCDVLDHAVQTDDYFNRGLRDFRGLALSASGGEAVTEKLTALAELAPEAAKCRSLRGQTALHLLCGSTTNPAHINLIGHLWPGAAAIVDEPDVVAAAPAENNDTDDDDVPEETTGGFRRYSLSFGSAAARAAVKSMDRFKQIMQSAEISRRSAMIDGGMTALHVLAHRKKKVTPRLIHAVAGLNRKAAFVGTTLRSSTPLHLLCANDVNATEANFKALADVGGIDLYDRLNHTPLDCMANWVIDRLAPHLVQLYPDVAFDRVHNCSFILLHYALNKDEDVANSVLDVLDAHLRKFGVPHHHSHHHHEPPPLDASTTSAVEEEEEDVQQFDDDVDTPTGAVPPDIPTSTTTEDDDDDDVSPPEDDDDDEPPAGAVAVAAEKKRHRSFRKKKKKRRDDDESPTTTKKLGGPPALAIYLQLPEASRETLAQTRVIVAQVDAIYTSPSIVAYLIVELTTSVMMNLAFFKVTSAMESRHRIARAPGSPFYAAMVIALVHPILIVVTHALEMAALMKENKASQFFSLWNMIDMGCVGAVIASFATGLGDRNGSYRVVASVSCLIVPLRILRIIKGLNQSIGAFVLCLTNIIAAVVPFCFVFALVLLSFAQTFHLLFEQNSYRNVVDFDAAGNLWNENPFSSMAKSIYEVVRIALIGDLEADLFDTDLAIFLIVVFLFVVVIVLLNILIAVVGDSYEKTLTNSEAIYLRSRFESAAEMQQIFPKTWFDPNNYKIFAIVGLIFFPVTLLWVAIVTVIHCSGGQKRAKEFAPDRVFAYAKPPGAEEEEEEDPRNNYRSRDAILQENLIKSFAKAVDEITTNLRSVEDHLKDRVKLLEDSLKDTVALELKTTFEKLTGELDSLKSDSSYKDVLGQQSLAIDRLIETMNRPLAHLPEDIRRRIDRERGITDSDGDFMDDIVEAFERTYENALEPMAQAAYDSAIGNYEAASANARRNYQYAIDGCSNL